MSFAVAVVRSHVAGTAAASGKPRQPRSDPVSYTHLDVYKRQAFFLESTFLAVWAFGWERVSKKVHLTAIWLVAIASNLSALWIILANGWMQNPVGYVIKNGRAELSSFFDVVTNPFAWSQYFHTIFAAWMLGGFFVLGVSSWHLLRKNDLDLFKRCLLYTSRDHIHSHTQCRRRCSLHL